jgi:hypothetical protein
MEIYQHGCFEARFESLKHYENPIQEVSLSAEFVSPSGKAFHADGYWDGGKIWCVRFSPEETGRWDYRCWSNDPANATLNSISGQFTCSPYIGNNPLYCHGPLKVSANGRFLSFADDTPFFWLGDTVWNGALLSTQQDWETYLDDRQAKGFSVIQFVSTHWFAAAGNAEGRQACYGREKILIDPVFHERMDARIQAINRRGMVAAPVLAWAANWNPYGLDLNPGTSLPEDQLLKLVQYQTARWGASPLIWILAGDADYRGAEAERWKRIVKAVWGSRHNRLATMHPGGGMWVGEEFRGESWFDFIGYQSGHSSSPKDLSWHLEGPPAQAWAKQPALPVINLEPNYEAHHDSHTGELFDSLAVRRAAYWSLLVSPPAGVTYGAHGVWSWESAPAVPMNHLNTAQARPWLEAIHLPGSMGIKYLRQLFGEIDWWELEPARDLLLPEALDRPLTEFVAMAASPARDWALAYLPAGGTLPIQLERMKKPPLFRWYDPRTGTWLPVSFVSDGLFTAPDKQDWVLWIGR